MTDNHTRHWEKYFNQAKTGEGTAEVEDDLSDNLLAFGWLRGVRDQAIMLEVRHSDGRITALAYGLLERAEFNPSDGITLTFAKTKLKIAGRNLNAECRPNLRLLAGIMRRRVPWIQEADEGTALEAPKGAVLIETVEVT